MLTCLALEPEDSPDSKRYWSNLLHYFGHSSGIWKLNRLGGYSSDAAIPHRFQVTTSLANMWYEDQLNSIVFLRIIISLLSGLLLYSACNM